MLRAGREIVRHLITKAGLASLHARVREAKGENVSHLFAGSLAERFSAVYRNRVWLNGRQSGSLSGEGSEVANTAPVRQRIPEILQFLGSQLLLDVGCGDFNWMKEVELPGKYIGVDIVSDVIEADEAAYGSDRRIFQRLDATRDPLPSADTILCREILFHLSFRDIWRVIENVHRSGASFFIVTNDTKLTVNADILSGDFRMLNLHKAPFLFPVPSTTIPDDCVASGRILGVWKVATIPRRSARDGSVAEDGDGGRP